MAGPWRTQRVTAVDLEHGMIRIPVGQKRTLPTTRSRINVVPRGTTFRDVGYDPRLGPDRERSGVISIGRRFQSLMTADEVLTIREEGDVVILE
jgi:hypothetical protein